MSDLHKKAAGIYEQKHYFKCIIILETNITDILTRRLWRDLTLVSFRLTLSGNREKGWQRKESNVYKDRFISMQK